MAIHNVLFLSTLLLASVSFSLANCNHHEYPSQQLEQCLRRCQEEKPRGLKLQQCQQQCRKQMQQQQGGHSFFSRDPDEQMFEQCTKGCQSRQHGREQQRQCSQQCAQRTCQQHCQRQHMSDWGQQQQCQERCMKQLQQGDDLETNTSRDPEQKLEQCQQRCQSKQQGQQQCRQQCALQMNQQEQQCRQQCAPQMNQQERQQMCQQHCEMQDSQCQRRCMQQLEQGELDINKSKGPEKKLEECQLSCQSTQQGQEQCREQCAQQLSQQERLQICQKQCKKHDSQCQRRCVEQHEQGEQDINTSRDPEQKLEQCQQSCQSRQQGQQQCRQQCAQQLNPRERQQICDERCQTRQSGDQQQCQRRCQQQLDQGQSPNYYQEEMTDQQEEIMDQQQETREQQEETMDQQQFGQGQSQMNNPYHFPSDMFKEKFKSEEGRMYVLDKFTKNQSPLLDGIRNYRLAIFEAQANTFILPHHCDAESIFVVISGGCTSTVLMQGIKESYNLEEGDVLRVPAGATVYLVNTFNFETLKIAKLHQPVNTPGRFEHFFPATSQGIYSYFNAFSDDILESSLNTPIHQIQRVSGQPQSRQGMVMRASTQQLQALTKHASSAKNKGGKGAFNMQTQKPIETNQFGRVFLAGPEKFEQLQDMDVSVTCIEINNRAMMMPHYNSKAIFVVYVVKGSGRIEMASPGQSQEAEEQSGSIMKVTADIKQGDVFVVPAGYPIAIVAQNRNYNNKKKLEPGVFGIPQLRMLGFGINATNNKRNYITGTDANPIRVMEPEAKQLTFGQEMEEIMNRQPLSYFAPIRQSQQQRGGPGNEPWSSILEVVAEV